MTATSSSSTTRREPAISWALATTIVFSAELATGPRSVTGPPAVVITLTFFAVVESPSSETSA